MVGCEEIVEQSGGKQLSGLILPPFPLPRLSVLLSRFGVKKLKYLGCDGRKAGTWIEMPRYQPSHSKFD
jgi:hypothetical protein